MQGYHGFCAIVLIVDKISAKLVVNDCTVACKVAMVSWSCEISGTVGGSGIGGGNGFENSPLL